MIRKLFYASLAAEITTEAEIAMLLAMSLDEFGDLRLKRLPRDNEDISKKPDVTVERVYKLRYRAGGQALEIAAR